MAADKREPPDAPDRSAGSTPTASTATDEPGSLRRRAEDAIRSLGDGAAEEPELQETERLLHELCVRQIELEMQNDELLRTHEKLDASLARYHELYDFAPVGYVTLDEDRVILEANLTATTLFGWSTGELVSQPLSRFVHRDDQDVFYHHFRGLFAKQKPRENECELRLVHKNGSPFWARLTSIAALPEKSETRFCRTVINDITERRSSERERVESEQRLRDAMDAACLISWDWDPASGRVTWTGRLDEATAPGSSGVVDDPEAIRRLVLADDLGALLDARDAARDRGTGFEHEVQVLFPDGSTRWLSARGAYEYDQTGRAVRARGITRDVTKHKQEETELRESEKRYRELVENFNDMIYVVGADGAVSYVSPAVRTILGYTPDELVGATFTEFVHPDDLSRIRNAFDEVMAGRIEPREYRMLDKTGAVRWVRTSSRPLFEDGTVVGLQGILTDITERRRAEMDRDRLLSEIRGLAARLAEVEEAQRKELARELHDRIGQNLTALGLNLTVLRDRLSATELARVRSNLDDTVHLVVETTSEIRQVMTELRPPMIDDYGLVATLRWFAELFSERTGMSVTVVGNDLDSRLGDGVEIALFRIVQEALTNVAKHAGGASVEISVAQNRESVRVTVADDGRGFTVSSRPVSELGSGWGLTIMKERAAAIGGTLHVASEPGVGTTIVVELGVARA